MITRSCRAAAATLAVVLVALGLLIFPAAVAIMWAVAALFVGPLLALCIYNGGTVDGSVASHRETTSVKRRADAVHRAAVATAVIVVVSAASAGLTVVWGSLAAVVIPVLLTGAGIWGWRHRHQWPHQVALQRRSDSAAQAEPGCTRVGLAAPTGSGHMSIARLCAVWQQSYWALLSLPSGRCRHVVVEARQAVLDELERRDPAGFGRWLATQPRANSDPGRHLSVDQ